MRLEDTGAEDDLRVEPFRSPLELHSQQMPARIREQSRGRRARDDQCPAGPDETCSARQERCRVELPRDDVLRDDDVEAFVRHEVCGTGRHDLEAPPPLRREPFVERFEARRVRVHQHVAPGAMRSRHRRIVPRSRTELQHVRIAQQCRRDSEGRRQPSASRDERFIALVMDGHDVMLRVEVQERAPPSIGPHLVSHCACLRYPFVRSCSGQSPEMRAPRRACG